MQERAGIVTMHGNPVTLLGTELKVGDEAPDFRAVTTDLGEFRLSSLRGKTVILSAVPSLDTRVCEKETKRFSAEAEGLGPNVRVVTVSMDLPFAQGRWLGEHNIRNILVVSDHRDADFGWKYGVLMKEFRLLARAVFVVDRLGKIAHLEIVPEVAREPDYAAALGAVFKAAA